MKQVKYYQTDTPVQLGDVATVVDPDPGFLKKKVTFVRRGIPKDLPEKDPFVEPGEIEDDFGVSKER